MEKDKRCRKILVIALVAIMVIAISVAFAHSTAQTQPADSIKTQIKAPIKTTGSKEDTKQDVDESIKQVEVKSGTQDVNKSDKSVLSPGCENSYIYGTSISYGYDPDSDGCLESFYLEIDADTPGGYYCDVKAYITASTGEYWWTTCWTIYDGSTLDNAFIYFDAAAFATTTECEAVILTVYLYTCDGVYTGTSAAISANVEYTDDEIPDGQIDYWAVIVGVADYTGTANDLQYTDDDAIEMYNTLLLSGDYWQPDHIMLLLDSSADRSGILTAFSWLDENEDPDDEVFFFFSGHGTYDVDDDGDEADGWDEYICPYDFNDISDDELDAELDRLGSTSIAVIMDTCFAGGMTKGHSVKTLPKPKAELTDGFARDLAPSGKEDMGESGRVVLMACDDAEYSYELAELENGLFSYYVIEGLGGIADAEGNRDLICSAEETFEYASPQVVDFAPMQHPQLYDGYVGELPLTISLVATASDYGVYRNGQWILSAGYRFNFGNPTDKPVTGDWDGVGECTIGVYRNGQWILRDSNSAGTADYRFNFGNQMDKPVTGDWNGDGECTIGVYRNGDWILRNSNSAGSADYRFNFGNPTDIPVTGDWNDDGECTIGVYRNGEWILRDSNSAGAADYRFNFGNPTDKPVTGDWNGGGDSGIGVRRGGEWILRNDKSAGASDYRFGYGNPTDKPVTGDWD